MVDGGGGEDRSGMKGGGGAQDGSGDVDHGGGASGGRGGGDTNILEGDNKCVGIMGYDHIWPRARSARQLSNPSMNFIAL